MSAEKSAVLCLSGGLDSAANLELALPTYRVEVAVTFNYGQESVSKEVEASSRLCQKYGIDHLIVDLPFLGGFSSALLSGGIPNVSDAELASGQRDKENAAAVWVANRNGIFANIAAGIAEDRGQSVVLLGFNLEEAQTFPDNSASFIKALNESLSFSTQGKVSAESLTVDMTKSEIVARLKEREFSFDLLWSCYRSGDHWCGRCESCQRLRRAMVENGLNFDQLRGARAD